MTKNLIVPSSSSSGSSSCDVTTNTEKIKNHYIFTKEVMGKGTFGTVRKVKNKVKKNKVKKNKQQQQQQVVQYYACKTIPKSKYKDGNMKLIKEEVTNLGLVRNHPHILNLEQAFEDNKKIDIITELLEGGELYETICEMMSESKNITYFQNDDCAYMISNILDALRYCHDVAGIVHRDLTASNFMFKHKKGINKNQNSTNKKNSNYSKHLRDIKIIDFGLSSKVDPITGYVAGCVGTPYYVAPELLTDEFYTNKCDVWSIGVVSYLMLSFKLPYQGRDESDTVDLLLDVENHPPDYQSKRWIEIKKNDPEAISFCQHLLQKDPTLRPSMKEAMQHPWIVKHCGVPLPPPTPEQQQNKEVCDSLHPKQQTELIENIATGDGDCDGDIVRHGHHHDKVVEGTNKTEVGSSPSSSLLSLISHTSSQSSSDAPGAPDDHKNNFHQHHHSQMSQSNSKKKKKKKTHNILQRFFFKTS